MVVLQGCLLVMFFIYLDPMGIVFNQVNPFQNLADFADCRLRIWSFWRDFNCGGIWICIRYRPEDHVSGSENFRTLTNFVWLHLNFSSLQIYAVLVHVKLDIKLYRTAKTQYRKVETNIPRKRNCVASVPIFIFMCLWAIYLFPHLVCLFCCRKICRPVLGIYKSLADTWTCECGNRDWDRAVLGIHKWNFRCIDAAFSH